MFEMESPYVTWKQSGQPPSACVVRCTCLLAVYFLRIFLAALEFARARQVRLS